MSTLQAILELQGSLDTAVIRSADPMVPEIADAFLPGASSNPDWYREIQAFMFPEGGDHQLDADADPITALENLVAEQNENRPAPTIPEAARLIFSLGAVIRLTGRVPIEPYFRGDPGTEDNRGLLAEVFSFVAPETQSADSERLNDAVRLFREEFTGWRAWYNIANQLVEMGVLRAEIATVPMCLPTVVTIDGVESVVIDTELSTDKVSLNALKAVVDPRNWHKDYPSFFCAMEYKGLRSDGWRKVLEHVGFCDIDPHFSPRLHTMLKFYKTTVNGPDRYEARLDYDLNDPVLIPPGDGKITVDRGFINMWSTKKDPAQKGVAVRTRKVAHIEGLRPYTMKRFVCAFGYGFAVAEMLFGSAANYKGGDTDYTPWEDPATETPEQGSQASQLQGPGTAPEPHPDNSVASTAISMIAKCVQDLSVKQFDLADKWMAGQLTVEDLAQHTAEVGARIASDPWKFIQAISQPKPKGGTSEQSHDPDADAERARPRADR
jgi:hypothetical protein